MSQKIFPESSLVTLEERLRLTKAQPKTIWFYGLSGSGKSTISLQLERLFMDKGQLCYRLDGDNLRSGLCQDLGFGEKDRHENVRRAAEVAKLFNASGLYCICSFVTPLESDRQIMRSILKGHLFEVFVDTPLEICEQRDTKGLYKKARQGLVPNFTGISAPFETPSKGIFHIGGKEETPLALAMKILEGLV